MQLSPRLPWYGLLGAVVLVPLAVGVIPLAGTLITLNAFVQAKLIVLALTLAFTLATWTVTRLREGSIYVGRALIPLAAFLVVAALSTVAAIDSRLAFFGDFEQGVGLLVFLLCGLLAYLTTQLIRDEKHLRILTSAVVLTATTVAGIGLLQQVLAYDLLGIGKNLPLEWIIQRGYGTIGNADTYAAYLVLPAVLALHGLAAVATPSDRAKWAGCFATIVVSCVMAQTRGPLAGLVVGVAAYTLSGRRSPRKPTSKPKAAKPAGTAVSSRVTTAIVAAAVGIGVLAATIFSTANDLGERFGSIESLTSLGGRVPLWTSALKIAVAHPLLGIGADSFRLGWYPVRQVTDLASGAGLVITDPHSVPLLIAATMGITGLLAAAYLLVATLVTGFRTASRAHATRGYGSDYDAWLCGAIALSVTLLASMLTSVLVFMLFLALGVLLAPALHETLVDQKLPLAGTTMRVSSLLVAVALAVFALLTAAAQATAIGARIDEASLASARAARAASLAPWDTEIRNLKYETMVQAALDRVFTEKADATSVVAQTEESLTEASRRESHEYLFPYRLALLLIGSGQKLGAEYTKPGIAAGLEGLRIYPNSLELRTGVASGYLTLDEPAKAEAMLKALWNADPAYLPSGLTYVESLAAQAKTDAVRAALSVLKERFPGDQAVLDLEKRVSSE